MLTGDFRFPHDRKGSFVKTSEEKEQDRVRRITEAPTEIIEHDGISDDARSNMRGFKWFFWIALVVSVIVGVIAYYYFNQPKPAP